MNKVLFFLVAILLLTTCDNGKEESMYDREAVEDLAYQVLSESFDKKYGVFIDVMIDYPNYSIGMCNLKDDDSCTADDIIWRTSIDIPEDEIIDVGYGQVEYYPYKFNRAFFIRDSYNIVVEYKTTLWNYKCFCIYDITGELFYKSGKIHNVGNINIVVCPWDNAKFLTYNEDVYYVFDRNGNEEKYSYIDNEKEPLGIGGNVGYMKWVKVRDNHYFAYSYDAIIYLQLNTNEIQEENIVDIQKYIANLYPQEDKIPKIDNIRLEIFPDNSIAFINVVLYNGEKNNIQIVLDNQTGKIIK